MDKFCNLHLHSTYSYTDGYGLPEQYVKRAVEIGQPGIGVTDHGNISVHHKWYTKCKKAGMVPVLGCEFYIVEDIKDVRTRDYSHITILAKNNVGYANLTRMLTKAWTEQFYYKPRITYQDLFDHQEGLIVLSGCLSSPAMHLIQENRMDEAEKLLRLFNEKIEDFWIEIQPVSFPEGKLAYEKLIKLFKEKLEPEGFKWVATSDCHYVLQEQHKIQEILLCIQSSDVMSNPDRWKFSQNDFYLKSRDEMKVSLESIFTGIDFTDALDNSIKIMESVDFTFPMAESIKFPIPQESKIPELRRMCEEGLIKRGLDKEQIYRDRMEREFDLILKKNFVDYFLAVTDMVQWAKKTGILVGPARGSAAGSLICYLLHITEVEPIKYGLIFERFIDINREDLPDIDMDFEDVRRHEIKEYLEKKYGRDKVGNLPTYAVFKGKSALDDVRRVFDLPRKVVEQVKHAIIERSGGDSRASFTLEDTFNSTVFEYPKQAIQEYPELHYAVELEGQLRQMGQHAAGVIISNEPLTNFCAMYKIRDSYITSIDYHDATDIGLLKLDILGLNTLSVVTQALRNIKERKGIDINVYELTLDDPNVYKAFCDGKLFGIFQFEGQAVNQVCRQIQPKTFESLSAISALARPGPLNSGNTTLYINRKNGKETISYVHPVMEGITGDSYGIVIYQEQVMRVMREIGKMSWEDTSSIRKNISRSKGVEAFDAFRDKFIPGALETGLTQEQANHIWEEMCHYGSWSFNKSHSVSYTVISYWTMWLKVYYPMEFYGAILSIEAMEDKKKKILKEYQREGYKVLPIDVNKSKKSFSIEEGGLRIGFTDVKGIGEKAAEKMEEKQPYSSYKDFGDRTKSGEKIKQTLINLGALDSLDSGKGQTTLFGEFIPEFSKHKLDFSERFAICPWDMEFGIDKNYLSFIKDNPKFFKKLPTPIETLNPSEGFDEDVIYGIVYDRNLKHAKEEAMSKGREFNEEEHKIVHLISESVQRRFHHNEYVSQPTLHRYEKKHEVKFKKGEDYILETQHQFANFVLEDDTDFITVRLSAIHFPLYGKMVLEEAKADDVMMVKGKMGSGIRMFFCSKVLNLSKMKREMEAKNKDI
jgi:DNA polymerase-3 subunit alpha